MESNIDRHPDAKVPTEPIQDTLADKPRIFMEGLRSLLAPYDPESPTYNPFFACDPEDIKKLNETDASIKLGPNDKKIY